MPSSPRLPAPTAPFEVPTPERNAPEHAAPAPSGTRADEAPGLTSWGSEAIRLLAAELGYTTLAATHSGTAGHPHR